MTWPENPGAAQAGLPSCARHPDRPTGLSCTRCGRPACPECLREASVGYQCVDCVNEGSRTVRRPVNLAGAEVSERLWVVPALIIINLLVFGVTAAQVNGDVSRVVVSPLFLDWAMWPQGVALGQWWRLLTAGFLHLGLIHLLVNMVSLWIIGRDVERALGAWRFLAVYLVSLLGGSVAIQLFSENGGAGASGAIYGVMGALTVLFLRTRMNPAPALGMIAINLVISVSIPGISLVAHLGGLALGVAVTAGMVYPPAPLRNRVQLATVVGLVVLLIGLVLLDTSVLGQLSS